MLYDPIVLMFFQAFLMLVFGIGEWSKLRSIEVFEGVVYNYRLLPEPAVRSVARGLPLVELAVALGLLFVSARPYAAGVAVVLLAVFTVAIAVNLMRDRREIDCGCFSSVLKQTLSWWLVLRNLAFIAMAAWLVHVSSAVWVAGWTGWLVGGAAALTLGLLYVTWGILATVPRRRATTRHQAHGG